MLADAVVEKHLGHRHLALAFGEHELGVLKFDDLLAERLPLLDVVDRQLERALHHRHGVNGDDQPFLRQFVHQLDEALTFLGAEQTFGRQRDVLEEQFRRVGGIHAELLQLAAAPEAWRIVGLDHHQRDALGAALSDRSWRRRRSGWRAGRW